MCWQISALQNRKERAGIRQGYSCNEEASRGQDTDTGISYTVISDGNSPALHPGRHRKRHLRGRCLFYQADLTVTFKIITIRILIDAAVTDTDRHHILLQIVLGEDGRCFICFHFEHSLYIFTVRQQPAR